MNNVYLACSLKDLESNYNALQQVRNWAINSGWGIVEDWLEQMVKFEESKPVFRVPQGFDYLQSAINAISAADLNIIFFTCQSTFITTLIKYSLHKNKSIVVIYKNISHLKQFNLHEKSNVYYIQLRSVKKLKKILCQ